MNEGKLGHLEKASVLSASDDPKDQDKAREIRVRHDYENLRKQIGSKKKPTKPAIKEAKRDEYGDPVGGPKISKKKKAKNLSSNTPDEQHTTTTSEAVGAGVPLTPQELEIQKKCQDLM